MELESTGSWFKWCKTSTYLSILAETRLLAGVYSTKELFSVPIFDKTSFIRTIRVIKRNFTSETDKLEYFKRIPIVLVHGVGAGLALFNKNYDDLCQYRQVYSFDLIGFGNSSRIDFPDNHEEVENKFIESIEQWRNFLKIKKMILIGHSLGGFLSYAYGIQYSKNIAHLILVDTWGFRENKPKSRTNYSFVLSFLFQILSYGYRYFNPLFPLRLLGPYGPTALRYMRQDLGIIFKTSSEISDNSNIMNELSEIKHEITLQDDIKHTELLNDNKSEDNVTKVESHGSGAIYDYIYHCNVKHPSGEMAFRSLASRSGWVNKPIMTRINGLDPEIDCTFIYGGKSWMDWSTGYQVQFLRDHSRVNVKVIDKAGHHVYAEANDAFNAYVNQICISSVDNMMEH